MAAGDIIGAVSWHFLVKRTTIVTNSLGERLSVAKKEKKKKKKKKKKKREEKRREKLQCFFVFTEYEQGTVSPPWPKLPMASQKVQNKN